MKKTFLGVIILSSLSVAGNIKYEFNSKFELDGEKGKMSSKFTPFDVKMNINDNITFNFNANLDQKNIYNPKPVYYYIQRNFVKDDGKYIPSSYVNIKNDENFNAELPYTRIDGSSDYIGDPSVDESDAGGHEHSHEEGEHDHDHEHSHEHNHEHGEEEHDVNKDDFKLERYITNTQNKVKGPRITLGFKYEPDNRKSFKYTFMPNGHRIGKIEYAPLSSVIDGKYILVLDDSISFNVRPKISFKNIYNPYYLDLTNEVKTKINSNIFFNIGVNNKLQLDVIKERYNFKNGIDVSLDYNIEKKRYHEFWEVLDHSHDKIEQAKIDISFYHTGNYRKIPLNNAKLKFDRKIDMIDFKLSTNFKKSNVFGLGFDVSNDSKLEYKYSKIQDSNRKYIVRGDYYSLEENKGLKENKADNIKRFTNVVEGDDFSSMHDYYYFKNKENKEYMGVMTYSSTNPEKYIENDMKEIKFENITKINSKKMKLDIENKFKLNRKISEDDIDMNIKNETLLKYSTRLKKGFSTEFILENKNETNYENDKIVGFNNVVGTKLDINYLRFENGIKFKGGLMLGANLELRKSESVEKEGEKDKLVIGQGYNVKPYIELNIPIIENMKFESKLEIDNIFGQTVINKNGHKYKGKDEKLEYKKTKYKLNLGVKYNW